MYNEKETRKKEKTRFISGFSVGQYFGIREKSLVKLRKELMRTDNIVVPEHKKEKITSNFWYNLDYLLSRYKPIKEIPQHLVK